MAASGCRILPAFPDGEISLLVAPHPVSRTGGNGRVNGADRSDRTRLRRYQSRRRVNECGTPISRAVLWAPPEPHIALTDSRDYSFEPPHRSSRAAPWPASASRAIHMSGSRVASCRMILSVHDGQVAVLSSPRREGHGYTAALSPVPSVSIATSRRQYRELRRAAYYSTLKAASGTYPSVLTSHAPSLS